MAKASRENASEFDAYAESYEQLHAANTAGFGEEPAYFSEYKIADLFRLASEARAAAAEIFDFGSGIGNSVPFFRRYFAASHLTCGDVSALSLALAQRRFPGAERHVLITADAIPLPDESQDVVFSACVFHHIPPEQHNHWLRELLRITRRGGLLVVYEHNPYNPLTVRAVNTCPFDANARLIRAGDLQRTAGGAGWTRTRIGYKLFFPRPLAALRPLEPFLVGCPLGAQYRLAAWRP